MGKANAKQAVQRAEQLIAQGSFRQASQITEQLVAVFPKNPAILKMHAMTLHRRGLFAYAIEVLIKVKALLVPDTDEHINTIIFIANIQAMLGDLAGSVQTLLDAQALSDSMHPAIAAELVDRYVDLNEPKQAAQVLAQCNITAQLTKETTPALACAWGRAMNSSLPIQDIIAQLSIVADSSNNSPTLAFALGRLLEKDNRYDEAFVRYQQANAFNPPPYQSDRTIKRAQSIQKNFTAELLNSTNRPVQGDQLIRPILIVGMPRSGTTLTEQILGAHPLIAAAGESQALPEIARTLSKHPTDEHAQRLQAVYLNELRVSANITESQSPRFVTDKNLMNLFLIGLAHAIVPEAIIINVQRDLRDVCFSCFMSPLANDHNYKFNLANCAHFAAYARQTINHFKPIIQADPRTTWIDLSYEQLTQSPESTITNLFAAIELEPHQDCFDFHTSDRAVRTISKDQVREPMHTKSIARWEKFAHIPEVKAMLVSLKGDGLID